MAATLSSKGQVTIPKQVRDALGLKAGDAVVFVTHNGEAILRKRKIWTLDEVCGCLHAYAEQGPDIRYGHKEALAEVFRERVECGDY